MGARLPATERLPVKDDELRRVQEKLVTFCQAVARVELLHGRAIKGVALGGGAVVNPVEHKLGRTPLGWLVTAVPFPTGVGATYYESALRDEKFLYLTSSAAVTVDLWVW